MSTQQLFARLTCQHPVPIRYSLHSTPLFSPPLQILPPPDCQRHDVEHEPAAALVARRRPGCHPHVQCRQRQCWQCWQREGWQCWQRRVRDDADAVPICPTANVPTAAANVQPAISAAATATDAPHWLHARGDGGQVRARGLSEEPPGTVPDGLVQACTSLPRFVKRDPLLFLFLCASLSLSSLSLCVCVGVWVFYPAITATDAPHWLHARGDGCQV